MQSIGQQDALCRIHPKETITASRTISIPKPTEKLTSIFIGCYELQGTKEFIIKNQNSNRLTFNVFSNYYSDGQIRQMKFLIKIKLLYIRDKSLMGSLTKAADLWNNIEKEKGGS